MLARLAVAVLGLTPTFLATTPSPPFASSVSRVSAANLTYSYRPGCPLRPARLRLLHVRFWGFDSRAHMGSLVVNAAVVGSVRAVFQHLYEQRFPIRRMDTIETFRGDDAASMAADNTSAFNCRYAVAPGPHHWSMHAYGEAIDVNPVENPYIVGGRVLPKAGSRYRDRARQLPGMAVVDGTLVRAFAAVGWGWGGAWSGSPDYQHFSLTGG